MNGKRPLRGRSGASPIMAGLTRFVCAIAVVFATGFVVHAQVNIGGVQQGIGRQQNQFEQQAPAPLNHGLVAPKREKAQTVKSGGPKFLLRKVVFDKSKFLTSEELNAVASKYVGKQVDIAALLQIVADVNALYEKKGIATGIATLPQQKAQSGIIRIKLTEGRLEKQTLQGNDQTSSDYILHRVGEPTGDVLDIPKLNRDVTWFNRTNDTQIKALLQPGSSFGLTDLNFATTEAARNTLELFCDNQGIQSTGAGECGTFYKLHSLFGVDDRLTFYGVKSSGNINGSLSYNIPINDWGGRLGASYTQGNIKIVEGPFVPLDETGTTKIGSVNLSQPFAATEKWLVLGNLAATEGRTQSDLASVANVNDFYNKETGGLQVSYLTPDFSATVSMAGNAVHEHDIILAENRDFATFTSSWNARLQLPKNFYVSDMGSMQYASAHLLPGDQLFVIGGPTTVRGYATNIVEGDGGYYNNLELHRDWSDFIKGFDTYIFLDSGEVLSTSPARIDLMSAGGGFSWTPVPAFTLQGSFGAPTRTVETDQPRYEAYFRVIVRPLLFIKNPS